MSATQPPDENAEVAAGRLDPPVDARAGMIDGEVDALEYELAAVRSRLAVAEGLLANPGRTRLGVVARLLREAARDPIRRRRLGRELVRALVDRSVVTMPRTAPGRSRRMVLPDVQLPDGPVARPGLRVAVVLDSFSELALRYEWDQVTFGPSDWREVLEPNPPQLLFVESAWHGNGGAWRLHMTRSDGPSDQLKELVAWCRERQIPTVFWNKEDPPNYARFIRTAELFDHVFTVDADCVPDYERELGHDRIGLLPFAAQPRLHNPVRRGPGRVYDVAFAGTYFAEKHPDRREQMKYLLEPALDFGLHIYSRLQDADPRYRFPAKYVPHIVGSLPYPQMLGAYTSYKAFLNVNSVTTSKTMCARRLFELSAAQTAVISAPAPAIAEFFGDDVHVVHNPEETRDTLTAVINHDDFRDRLALRAHRRVFDEHLFGHRVDTVLETVGLPTTPRHDTVSVVVSTNRPSQVEHVLGFIGRQVHRRVQLVLVQHGFEVPGAELTAKATDAGIDQLVALSADESLTLGACLNLGVDAADGDFLAKMDDDNFYGRHYLHDLVRAFEYTDAEVVGKWAHLVHLEGSRATLLRFPHAEHRFVELVQGGTIMTRRSTAARLRFEDLPRRVDTTFLDKVRAAGGRVYSTDRFNFVSVRRADANSHTWKITEKQLLARRARLLFYGEPYAHAEV